VGWKDRSLFIQRPSESLLLQLRPFRIDRLRYVWPLRRETAVEKEDPAKAMDGLLSTMEFQVVGAAKAMPADKYSNRTGARHLCCGPDDAVRYRAHLCGTGDAPGAGELLLFRLERH
jgi:hypothetical protein